jgi:ubiquinone/menaquinone biosynthesis C-methylase UbiE/uncharacterized protein YbaR (Trm112 family)
MDSKVLDILCDPKTHKPLKQNGLLLEREDGKTFPIQNDIPVFLKTEDVFGLNLKYQRFYDIIARVYDWVNWFYQIFNKRVCSLRRELFKDLTITTGMKVLETSIGTGFNITLFTKEADYYGIDISMGMLQVCQRENRKWGYSLHLAQANAEELPIKDNIFDVVFHVGGINFFNDIPKAINEMIRVAKPGAQILICDETQEHVVKSYQRIPFVRNFFKEAKPVIIPLEFIPSGMKDVQLSHAWDGRMYVITFRKPL